MKFTGNAKTTSPLITGDKRRDEAVIVYILALADISQYEIANRLSVKPQTVNQVVKRKQTLSECWIILNVWLMSLILITTL